MKKPVQLKQANLQKIGSYIPVPNYSRALDYRIPQVVLTGIQVWNIDELLIRIQ